MSGRRWAAGGGLALLVEGLTVEVATTKGSRTVVEGVGFAISPGQTLCIAGESGSGKSLTAFALMGLLPGSARVAGGRALLGGRDLLTLDERAMRQVRGAEIGMIFQEPMTSLNPVLSIGTQLEEAIRAHEPLSGKAARERALQTCEAVRLSEPARRLRQYPHELSGGMRQRVMIAMAMACRPRVLIADEPTTALDVTIQAQILELMRELQEETGMGLLLITHDMGVVAEMADRVLVLRQGRVVEEGEAGQVFAQPKAAYTRDLLAAVPRLGAAGEPPPPARSNEPVVQVRDLSVRFDVRGGLIPRVLQRVHAVEGVSFELRPGETLGIVGESGCGKSTIAKALVGLVPSEGDIVIDGHEPRKLGPRGMKPVRRAIQMIFQDPYASLDPRMSAGELVAEPLVVHGLAKGSELKDRTAELFRRVGLTPEHQQRHPHEFSGGQRQRVCIARALSLEPKVVIADESVSALDVTVQRRVLDLLARLQAELGLAYIFISHDMAVVEAVSHRVAVMYLGQIVETGPRAAIFDDPRHAYTRGLLEAVPIPDPARRRARSGRLTGEVPSPLRAVGSRVERVRLTDVGGGHLVAGEMLGP